MNRLQSMADKLMAEDPMLTGEEYERYRENLKLALARAEFRERMAYLVCLASGVISFSLMFVGGSRIFGSFDPWDRSATPISITLGVTYVVASIVFWVLLASYYSRFRPSTRRAQETIRDEQVKKLERSVEELKVLLIALQESRSSSEPNKNNSDSD